jgi:hypothetical protein
MATIRKLVCQKGVSYKAIIKDKAGNHLKKQKLSPAHGYQSLDQTHRSR